MEVAVAQINAIKGFSKQAQMLSLSDSLEKYEVHPERATPHTVSEQLAYKTTYEEFVSYVTTPGKYTVITSIAELSNDVAHEYAAYMLTISQAVDTHNRKIKRLRKYGLIDDCAKSRSGAKQINGVMLRPDDPEIEAKKDDCFRRASYLAKTSTKNNTPKYQWEMFSSRIPK